jgi:hypothetical protein
MSESSVRKYEELRRSHENLSGKLNCLMDTHELDEDQQVYIYTQLRALTKTIEEMIDSTFDIDVVKKINKMQLECTPYMLAYWMFNQPDATILD